MANIVKHEQAAIEYTPEQVQLIKSQIAPKASNDELKLFLYQCQRTGLDPLTRQIYCIHRKVNNVDKMTIQTSIDGFRVIAERSGVYAGQGEPVFIEENGRIISCKVSVFKFNPLGVRYEAAVGVAYMAEYAQQGPMWQKMPHTMISKCAEAVALRKAFPQDLSGLYTSEEIEQETEAQITTVQKNGTDTKKEELPELDHSWYEGVEACKDQKELVAYYQQHKVEVDSNTRLQQLLADRRNQINGKKLSAA
jgi:phage recombination protein Bet